mmetsp:Transcript_17324/g.26810  ORF Transcript_17324/g.26810 Transcript_17324/m.26810 type:complete len:305 (-) Transcript_17324:139-1053(-)|eukprot:CAMPEP_0195281328 /NCGR_PEP_ID=MMETSP0707-20130614/685_1 /TAXON_ID=33640 /ORGANISM="Asterionellopsis glacialis, Strain CCMP134" /LENGTH=304 /DNA_ID=CAMNT_0040340203 /DNA_START=212 /DNA_END=1126 /DNA_ORIENTATION=-
MDDIFDFNNLGAMFLTKGNLDDACVMFKGSFVMLKIFLEVSLKRRKGLMIEDDEDFIILQDLLTKNEQFQNANALLVRVRVLEDEKLEKSMKDTEEGVGFTSDQDSDDSSISDSMSYTSTMSEGRELQEGRERSFSEGPPPTQYDNPFIYQRPLFVNDHVSFGNYFDEAAKYTSAVVLYNLALAEHIRWLSGLANSKIIEKIVRLYSQAHKTLQQMQEVSSTAARARLAIVNNLGQLHCEIGNFSAAKEYFNELHNIVRMHLSQRRLSPCIYTSEEVIYEEHFSIDDFFLNASILLSSLGAAAA